jgi:hypothetical protein
MLQQHAEYPFDPSWASDTVLRVIAFCNGFKFSFRTYCDAVIHLETGCGEVIARPRAFDVDEQVLGRRDGYFSFRVSVKLFAPHSSSLFQAIETPLEPPYPILLSGAMYLSGCSIYTPSLSILYR